LKLTASRFFYFAKTLLIKQRLTYNQAVLDNIKYMYAVLYPQSKIKHNNGKGIIFREV